MKQTTPLVDFLPELVARLSWKWLMAATQLPKKTCFLVMLLVYIYIYISLYHSIYLSIYLCIYVRKIMPGFCPDPQWRRATHHHHH
jgi:hypothetical protein